VQLGFENKKQMTWAAVLGVIAVLVASYEIIPFFAGSSAPASSAQAAAPALVPTRPAASHGAAKPSKKPKTVSLDPTLQLDLLATAEKTQYEGNGRNIFMSAREDVPIEQPKGPGVTDHNPDTAYTTPPTPPPPPIPLKFYGFASTPGEPKKIFLKNGDDVFVAGEGEIVDRRYKVIRISATSVEIQDMVYSGPPQNIPLTQG
jgi:hypothetical protein